MSEDLTTNLSIFLEDVLVGGPDNYVLTATGIGGRVDWEAGGGGGAGNPGGSFTSLQFNDSGAFGGFGTWDGTTLSTTKLQAGTLSGSASANGDLILQGTTHATKTTSITFLEPDLGRVQVGVPDPVYGLLDGGMYVDPPSNGDPFDTGGAFFLVTSPDSRDVIVRIAAFDNKQGIDLWNANASGDNFIDTRFVHRSDTETYTGTRLFFRMNCGGNVLIGNTGTPFELLTLAAGGSTSGGGMVGIGAGGFAPQAGVHITNAVLAKPSSGRAWGIMAAQALTAVANNDALTALTIDPTFSDGGKTGVKHNALVTTSGNVGIGTTTPAGPFEVSGQFIVLGNGHVGVHTATPGATVPTGFTAGYIFEIADTANDTAVCLRPFNLTTQGLDLWSKQSTGKSYIDNRWNNVSGDLVFRVRTDGTPVVGMTLDGFGEVHLGVAGTNKGLLHFHGNTSGDVTIQPNAVAGTVTQTLQAVTGTIALTANTLGDFASTTSAQLYAVMSNSTGTGLLTFSTAPTFPTTVSIGTVSGATAILKLFGTTSGSVWITTANAAGSWTLTLPTTAGTANYPLVTDGSGVASWSNTPALGTITVGTWGTGAVIAGATMTLGSDATGDLYYRNSSGVLTRIAAGARGTLLAMGASSVPAWGGGAVRRISVLNGFTLPDTSGNVWYEPAAVTQTNDRYPQGIWRFKDTATKDSLGIRFSVPADYFGAGKVFIFWTTTATSGNAIWTLDYSSAAVTASYDPSADEESLTVTTAAPGSSQTGVSSSMTLTAADVAANDLFQGKISRNGAGSDTIAADLVIYDIVFEYTIA